MRSSKEIAKDVSDVSKKTNEFLFFLSKISSFYYRRNFKLTDVEIDELINRECRTIVSAIQENIIMANYLGDPERAESFKTFRTEVLEAAFPAKPAPKVAPQEVSA